MSSEPMAELDLAYDYSSEDKKWAMYHSYLGTDDDWLAPPAEFRQGHHTPTTKRGKLKQRSHEFLETSTLHGPARMNWAAHLCRKIVWIIIFLIALIVCIVHCVYIVREYANYPKATVVERRYERKVPYPAVTFCNLNPLTQESNVTDHTTYGAFVQLQQQNQEPVCSGLLDPSEDPLADEACSTYNCTNKYIGNYNWPVLIGTTPKPSTTNGTNGSDSSGTGGSGTGGSGAGGSGAGGSGTGGSRTGGSGANDTSTTTSGSSSDSSTTGGTSDSTSSGESTNSTSSGGSTDSTSSGGSTDSTSSGGSTDSTSSGGTTDSTSSGGSTDSTSSGGTSDSTTSGGTTDSTATGDSSSSTGSDSSTTSTATSESTDSTASSDSTTSGGTTSDATTTDTSGSATSTTADSTTTTGKTSVTDSDTTTTTQSPSEQTSTTDSKSTTDNKSTTKANGNAAAVKTKPAESTTESSGTTTTSDGSTTTTVTESSTTANNTESSEPTTLKPSIPARKKRGVIQSSYFGSLEEMQDHPWEEALLPSGAEVLRREERATAVDAAPLETLVQDSRTSDLSDLLGAIVPDKQVLEDYSQPAEQVIKSCSFDRRHCNYKEFYRWTSEEFGMCYTFNSPHLLTEDSADYTNADKRKHFVQRSSANTGHKSGLRLTLSVHAAENVSLLSPEVGLRVVVHAPWTAPFPSTEGFNVAPGNTYSVAVKKKEVLHLDWPHDNCRSSNFEAFDYTQNLCLELCLERAYRRRCGCSVSDNPAFQLLDQSLRNVSVCDPFDYDNGACISDTYLDFANNKLDCDCPYNCLETQYTTEVSEAFPNKAMFTVLQNIKKINAGDDICNSPCSCDESTVRLHVYVADNSYERQADVALYSCFTLVANLGGSLALFIGFSIISFFELLEYLLDVLLILVAPKVYDSKRRSKVGPHSEPRKVYVLAGPPLDLPQRKLRPLRSDERWKKRFNQVFMSE